MATKRKAKAEEVEAELKSYKVLRNVRHDGQHYGPKSTVEMTAEEAAPLIKIGHLAPNAEPAVAAEAEAAE